MEESKRQKQVAGLIQMEMSDLFQREGLNMVHGGMISIAKVQVTPDLLEARIFLSFYRIDKPQDLLQSIALRGKELRKLLGARVRNQLRRIPEISFFLDDTLDHVFKMEELFKKINEEKQEQNKQPQGN
jgi:ribosome-binding factor A